MKICCGQIKPSNVYCIRLYEIELTFKLSTTITIAKCFWNGSQKHCTDLTLPSTLRLYEMNVDERRTTETKYTCNVINSLVGEPDSDARRPTELSILGRHVRDILNIIYRRRILSTWNLSAPCFDDHGRVHTVVRQMKASQILRRLPSLTPAAAVLADPRLRTTYPDDILL